MLKTTETSEEELIRKRELADKMAKKRARRDAFIAFAVVCTSIWLVANAFSTVVFLGLMLLGLLISTLCSWVTKEIRYNKYHQIFLQAILR